MSPRVSAGALGGFAGGVVLLAIIFIAGLSRLMPFDWTSVAADVFFPRTLAYQPGLRLLLGIPSHLVLAVFFGLVFVYVLDLRRDRNYFWLGVGYGVILEIVNLGLIAPALRLLAPIWHMDWMTIGITMLAHVVYGAVLAWVVNIYAETAAPRPAS